MSRPRLPGETLNRLLHDEGVTFRSPGAPRRGALWAGIENSATETLDIGSDLGSTVSESYVAPHSFTGKIEKVDIELK